MLISMTGQKRSGKDTVAAFMNEWEPTAERVSFAGTLKGMIALLLSNAGLTPDEIDYYMNGDGKETPLAVLQGKSARYAMQTLGTEWRDFLGKDLWTDIVRSKVGLTEHVVITDMRFLHEEKFVEENDGAKVRVVRAGQPAISVDAHKSEQEMAAIRADYTIFNHGSLDDLRAAAAVVYNSITRF
jgi:hypothetical protein